MNELKKILKRHFYELSKNVFILSLIFASAILPLMVKTITELKNSINSGLPALAVSYYQRIYNFDDGFMLGNFYVETGNFIQRSVDFYNLGEIIQRIGFKLFGNNLILSYYFFSLLYLSLWIYLIAKILIFSRSHSNIKVVIIVTVLLVVFFSNSSLISGLYRFSQIINPQFSIVIWLLGIFLLKKIFENENGSIYPYSILYFLNIIVASLSYIFVFISLLSTTFVAIVYFFIQKHRLMGFKFTILLFFSVTPYLIIMINNLNHKNFADLSERLGLVETRIPGAALTFVIACLSLIFILLRSKIWPPRKIDQIEKVLIISSLGLILASQSNVFTNKALQFSDHFQIFIFCNLVVLLSYLVSSNKFIKHIHLPPIPIFVIASFLIILSLSKTLLPVIHSNKPTYLHTVLNGKFESNDNIIVDTFFSDTFPIYSKGKMLYQNDIYTYKFSNRELLERYYISKGCPSNFSKESMSPILVYRIEANMQKAQSIEKYLKYMNLENDLNNFFIPLKEKAVDSDLRITDELSDFLDYYSNKSCISLAKSFDIDVILFDDKSNWNLILNNFKSLYVSHGRFNSINLSKI